jgi:hypothetical protein
MPRKNLLSMRCIITTSSSFVRLFKFSLQSRYSLSVSCRVAAVLSVRARCKLIQPVAENLFSNFKY